MRTDIKNICPKCAKRKTCKVLCYPVEGYLQRDNRGTFERSDENSTTLYPRPKEVHRSELSGTDRIDGRYPVSRDEAMAFSTANENPFLDMEPRSKQVSVFIKRFFAGWSFADIAAAEDITPENARVTYKRAISKLVGILLEMDAIKKMTPDERKASSIARSETVHRAQKEKQNSHMKRWREKNREKVRAQDRERRKGQTKTETPEQREKRLARQRRYRARKRAENAANNLKPKK